MKNKTLRFRLECILVVAFLGLNLSCYAQQLVSGTVSSPNGFPLPGSSVLIKGSVAAGVVTDKDGAFSIPAKPDDILIFSFIGFQTLEEPVNSRQTINVILNTDISTLSEVVVVGYGTQNKSDITGSVGSLKPKDLEQLPVPRVDQALQGRIPGVLVQNTDASPNSATIIRIRGYSSINGGNDPLVVIDGLQGGSLSNLNPGDIESIEVLKDASATAIYGSRGASGVVLVTTKSGKKSSSPTVTYNSFVSLSQLRKKIDIMNAADYATTVNENRAELGGQPVYTDSQIAGFKKNGGTDWQDAIFRNGYTQNHTVGISGGSDNVTYFISGNYLGKSGIIKNTSYDRFSLRSNLKAKLSEKLFLTLNAFIVNETDHPSSLNTFAGGNGGSPVYSALVWSPTRTIYDANGDYTLPGGGAGPKTNYNPVALALEPVYNNSYNTINLVSSLDYEIVKGLKVMVMGAYRSYDAQANTYLNSKPNAVSGSEVASISNSRTAYYQNTNMITYEKEFGLHKLKFSGVAEQQYQETNGSYVASQGFFTNSVTYNNLGLGQTQQPSSSSSTNRSLQSFMGRINYNFSDRFLLTLTSRADGSSVFGANNKWGFFPSVAAGWNILNESFMDNLRNTFSQLKIRSSYGTVGNQAVPPYGSLSSLNTGSQYALNGSTLNPGATFAQAPNPNLKWEKTTQFDVGLDIELLQGRLQVSADYYVKNTSDLLFDVSLPKTSGYTDQLRNAGSVQNLGYELFVGGKPVAGEFRWETGFTLGVNRNQVTALYSGTSDTPVNELQKNSNNIIALPGFSNSFWLQKGQPMSVFRGYVMEGVWKQSEASTASIYGAVPGAPKYQDVNHDGKIDDNDFVTIGNGMPKFTFGWNNSFSYKQFDLNVFIQGVQGNKIYNLSRVRMETTTGDADATSPKILNRWSPTHQNTDVPSFTGSLTEQFASSRWLEDGSYIRIKNIAVGYRLPKSALHAIGITSCRVYLSGMNLFTFTHYSGYDPEATAQTDALAGVDLATYPSQKSYTLGLDVKF